MFITQHICFPLFSVLSYDSYHVFWVKMTTLFGVSIVVTAYPENSKQTLLCNKHNVSQLILRYPFCHNRQGNHIIVVRHRFRKAPFSKCFPSTLKRKGAIFQIEEHFRKVLFLWRISVDRRVFKFLWRSVKGNQISVFRLKLKCRKTILTN